MDVLRVSARTQPGALAGAIAGVMREKGRVELHAIGAAAVNQATKAVATARIFLEQDGIDAVLIPAFSQVVIDDQEKTIARFVVESR